MLIPHKFKIGFFCLIFAFIMFSGYSRLFGSEQPPIDEVWTWVNQVRAQGQLEILYVDPQLNSVAETHSEQMAANNLLSDSNPELGTPYERIRLSGLTDINNLVAVAHAKNMDLLLKQLESPENLSKILSPEMTHGGVAVFQGSTGDLWLSIHLSERSITFTQFTLSQSNDVPASRSITISGNTLYEKIKLTVVPPEGSNPALAVDRIIFPDSGSNFEITYFFGTTTGNFSFEFSVQKDGVYILKNLFSMGVG